MAFDLLTALRAWKSPSVNGRGSSAGSEPVEVFIDVDNIDALHQPVNLNIHHHEELVARSEDQLVHWEAIMASPSLDERVSKLRSWYWDCIDDMEDRAAAAGRGDAVHKLDLSTLCHDITAADRVMFFGGSSLNILQRLIEQGVAGKLQCYVQAVRGFFPACFYFSFFPPSEKEQPVVLALFDDVRVACMYMLCKGCTVAQCWQCHCLILRSCMMRCSPCYRHGTVVLT